MNKDKVLAIIDVGMMEYGGHHAGFAEYIASTGKGYNGFINIYCSQYIDKRLQRRLESEDIAVKPVFKTEPYIYFGKPVGLKEEHSYISELAREYELILQELQQLTEQDNEVVCFYPSLNWDHANALAVALIKNESISLKQLACAMFNPGIGYDGRITNARRLIKFRHAFSLLYKTGVSIYSSDYELAWQYQRVMQTEQLVPIHPCYLTDWQKLGVVKPQGHRQKRVLLYIGDAKTNKGFAELPQIVQRLLKEKIAGVEYIVQFTRAWDDPDILPTIEWLQHKALETQELIVIEQFLSDDELRNLLATVDIAVFNYDRQEYQNKSSGILWLLAWYSIAIITLQTSWISREAQRLGVTVSNIRKEEIVSGLSLLIDNPCEAISERANYSNDNEILNYKNLLYQSFWSWLVEQ